MVQLRKCIREWESILQQMRCVCIPILHPFENGFSRWISIKVTKIWMFPKIRVPPKSSMLIGFSFISHPFWGTPILGNPHVHVIFNCCFFFSYQWQFYQSLGLQWGGNGHFKGGAAVCYRLRITVVERATWSVGEVMETMKKHEWNGKFFMLEL